MLQIKDDEQTFGEQHDIINFPIQVLFLDESFNNHIYEFLCH
jgi:hypothetical protein